MPGHGDVTRTVGEAQQVLKTGTGPRMSRQLRAEPRTTRPTGLRRTAAAPRAVTSAPRAQARNHTSPAAAGQGTDTTSLQNDTHTYTGLCSQVPGRRLLTLWSVPTRALGAPRPWSSCSAVT